MCELQHSVVQRIYFFVMAMEANEHGYARTPIDEVLYCPVNIPAMIFKAAMRTAAAFLLA